MHQETTPGAWSTVLAATMSLVVHNRKRAAITRAIPIASVHETNATEEEHSMIAVARTGTKIQGEGGAQKMDAISVPLPILSIRTDLLGNILWLIGSNPRPNIPGQDHQNETDNDGINPDLTTTTGDEKKNGVLVVTRLPEESHTTRISLCAMNEPKSATNDPIQKPSERRRTIQATRHSPRLLLFQSLSPSELNPVLKSKKASSEPCRNRAPLQPLPPRCLHQPPLW